MVKDIQPQQGHRHEIPELVTFNRTLHHQSMQLPDARPHTPAIEGSSEGNRFIIESSN
jgi:hypothetical protein